MRDVVMVGMGRWGSRIAERIRRGDLPLRIRSIVDPRFDVPVMLGTRVVDTESSLSRVDCTDAMVIVATPPTQRIGVIREAFERGAELVRVEKPLALSIAEAAMIRDLNRPVVVGHTPLFNSAIPTLRSVLVGSGVHRRWEVQLERYGAYTPAHQVSVLHDLAVHDLALLLSLDASSAVLMLDHMESYLVRAYFSSELFEGRVTAGVLHDGPGRRTATFWDDDYHVVYDEVSQRVWVNGRVVFDGSANSDALGAELALNAIGRGCTVEFGLRVVELVDNTWVPAREVVA